jgi:hypothetical protein
MSSRAVLWVLGAFCIAMNVLLWRAEYGASHALGSVVPLETVWRRMLTAPDDSSLAVLHRGQRIGFCRWAVNAGEESVTGKVSSENALPEGMVDAFHQYTVDLDGNVSVGDFSHRLRFSVFARFGTNHHWQEFELKTSLRPLNLEVHAHAGEERVAVSYADGDRSWKKRYAFEDLRNPQRLLWDFGGPAAVALLSALPALPTDSMRVGLRWEARHDWLNLGHSRLRVYRLQTRLLDRYQATLYISRVGEILRLELPEEVVLVNDTLITL